MRRVGCGGRWGAGWGGRRRLCSWRVRLWSRLSRRGMCLRCEYVSKPALYFGKGGDRECGEWWGGERTAGEVCRICREEYAQPSAACHKTTSSLLSVSYDRFVALVGKANHSHNSMQKRRGHRHLSRQAHVQPPHNRQRHDQHHRPRNHIRNRHVPRPRDLINAGPALDRFIPSERLGRALQYCDEGIGDAGGDYHEADEGGGDGE